MKTFRLQLDFHRKIAGARGCAISIHMGPSPSRQADNIHTPWAVVYNHVLNCFAPMGAHSKCHIMVIFMWKMTIHHRILEHPTLAPSLIEVSVDVVVSDSPMADAFSQSSSIVAATVLDSEDESQETELDSDAAE